MWSTAAFGMSPNPSPPRSLFLPVCHGKTDAEQYGKLTRACMEAVVPFMSWAPVEFVAQGNFVPMMIALLQDPQFRELAVEGIQVRRASAWLCKCDCVM